MPTRDDDEELRDAEIVRVDGPALRALRSAKRWTHKQLCDRSGVAERTLRRLEAIDDGRAKRGTARFLATALGTTIDRFAHAIDAPVAATAMPSRIAPSSVAQGVPKRSAAIVATPDPAARPKLDDLIAAEPIAAPLPLPELDAAARDRLAAPLTARALKQIMTAFRGYEGMRWSLRGTLTDHRGLRASDAAALRSKPGIAAAFRLEIPIANPRSFTVTIHSPDLPTTRALLERVGEEVALEARVWVAEESETFGGFRWFRTSKGFPWTLVVTAVAARGEG